MSRGKTSRAEQPGPPCLDDARNPSKRHQRATIPRKPLPSGLETFRHLGTALEGRIFVCRKSPTPSGPARQPLGYLDRPSLKEVKFAWSNSSSNPHSSSSFNAGSTTTKRPPGRNSLARKVRKTSQSRVP